MKIFIRNLDEKTKNLKLELVFSLLEIIIVIGYIIFRFDYSFILLLIPGIFFAFMIYNASENKKKPYVLAISSILSLIIACIAAVS